MKAFRCGDLVPGCSETFESASEEEVVREVGEHARRDHGLAVDDALVDEVRSRVHGS